LKIIAIEKEMPGVKAADFQPLLNAEAAKVWELYQSGEIREVYFRSDEHCAVLFLECATIEEAQTFLEGLPLVAAGLIRFELIPLQPYDGFARLFNQNT
jgi:hypothetical protein